MILSPGLTAYCLFISFALGAALGSFTDCAAGRRLRRESIFRGRSYCDACGHPLHAGDLIPLLSFLCLRGRCRYCGARVSAESFLTELGMGLAFLLLVWRFGISFLCLRYLLMTVLLFLLSLVDLKSYLIPDRYLVLAALLWLGTAALVSGERGEALFRMAGAPASSPPAAPAILSRAPERLSEELLFGLSGGLGLSLLMLGLSLLFEKLKGKESLGGGDIKLFFVAGLYLKPVVSFFMLIVSCILGLLLSGLLKKQRIPFGPAISLAIFLSFMIGSEFALWYTDLVL